MFNYFLYARKSTDTEDRQVLSIAAQLSELRAFAKRENLHIVETFVEKQSAKVPGRPIFSDMLARIEKGEAQGIICWKLDRLARNPIDGGQISWFLQRGIIQHIQTNDRGYLPADNVLMMSVEFGMANQYILDLSANTKRGQREKVRRGDYPGIAPLGYLNDVRIKKVVVDRKRSKIVRQAFEMYSQGDQRLEDIAAFFAENGITAKSKKPLHLSRVSFILSNPFYCGLFRYSGELHEGKHEQIIPKKLFDKVQEVLQQRTHIHRQPQNDPRPFCGLIRCGTCGMAITAERKTKHQKTATPTNMSITAAPEKENPSNAPNRLSGKKNSTASCRKKLKNSLCPKTGQSGCLQWQTETSGSWPNLRPASLKNRGRNWKI